MTTETMFVAGTDRADRASQVVDSMLGAGLSLRKASARHGVSVQSFLRAVAEDKLLSERYERARAAVIDRLADEVFELADAPIDKLDNGATDTGLVRQRQLQVDTRKWFLSKLAPKVYGDRLDVSVTETKISITAALQAAQGRMSDTITMVDALPGPAMAALRPLHIPDAHKMQQLHVHDAIDAHEDAIDAHEVHEVQHTTKAKAKAPWPKPKPAPEPLPVTKPKPAGASAKLAALQARLDAISSR